MVSRYLRIVAVAGAALLQTVTGTWAQGTSDNLVATKTDWYVYEEKSPRECWAVSAPKEMVNTREGRIVAVTRSDTVLMAFYHPDKNTSGALAFTGGYPFAPGSFVEVKIDDASYKWFTEGEWAWPESAADDSKIITAMKRGKSAVITARSARGTQTKDTFSLLGFTAAVEEAAARCK
ncbi:MAG: hypothetical protein JXR13_16720 [Thalassovita sp.]